MTTKVALEADRLAAEAAHAAEVAAAARARAEAAAKKAEDKRQAEITAIRRRRLEEYDDAALQAEERTAQDRFREAVLAGNNAVSAFIDWECLANKRYLLATEAESYRQLLRPDTSPIPTPGPAGRVYQSEVQRIIDHAVANRVEDLRDELQAELDGAGR